MIYFSGLRYPLMYAILEEFSGITKFILFNRWSCQKLHGEAD